MSEFSTTPLFDVQLDHDPEATQFGLGDVSLFPYIGSGGGTVSGPLIEGRIRWDFFEQQGERACRARRTGVIETTDGASVELEELGYFVQEAEGSPRWRFAGGVRFGTDDERYAWLTERPAVLEGEGDISTGKFQLRAALLSPPALPSDSALT